MTEKRWEHFAHGADIGVRGVGSTKEEAFEQAAIALSAVLTDPAQIQLREVVEVECEASEDELGLVDWLNAVIYEMATRSMIFGKYELRLNGNKLHARAWGEEVDVQRHQPAVEIKGATYTALQVGRNPQGQWIAECVVDV